jgi:predicted metal-dependent RNase
MKTKPKPLSLFEWTCLWAAMRYFCGRETIAAATFPGEVVVNYYHRLTADQKQSLSRQIFEHFYAHGSIGHKQIDQPHWIKFAAALGESEHIKVVATDNSEHVCFSANSKTYPLESYIKSPQLEIYLPHENIKSILPVSGQG